MKNLRYILTLALLLVVALLTSCELPEKKERKKTMRSKHNYIVLLDLSDRLVVQPNQPERDKQIVSALYGIFENKVKSELYVKSRDEFKVVIAPQRGSRLDTDTYEDRLFVNMENIKNIYRKSQEEDRRKGLHANLDTLYQKAVFSKNAQAYHGADIWKYFHEDLKVDYSKDTLTDNYLFILTDGYPVVGQNTQKLKEVSETYPELKVVLVEASPRDKDLEWDRVIAIWEDWFKEIGVKEYTFIKRGAISKEIEQIKEIVDPQS